MEWEDTPDLVQRYLQSHFTVVLKFWKDHRSSPCLLEQACCAQCCQLGASITSTFSSSPDPPSTKTTEKLLAENPVPFCWRVELKPSISF